MHIFTCFLSFNWTLIAVIYDLIMHFIKYEFILRVLFTVSGIFIFFEIY